MSTTSAAAMERHGLGGRWAYWDAINDVHHGMSRDQVRALYREAGALFNLCGAVRLRDEHMACPVRVMIDTDPVYEQIKYARGRSRGAGLSRRPHAFLHLWRECGRTGLDRAAGRHPVAGDAAAGGDGVVAQGRGRRRRLDHHRHLGEQGQEHRIRRRQLRVVEARQFPALPRPASGRARRLRDGDAAARRGGRAAGDGAGLAPRSIRARCRPT